jgi:pyruvate-formate lyase
MATNPKRASERWDVAWRGFAPGTWQSHVNVREFIQRNYTPYEGDGAFLQGATERTKGMWKTLQPLLAKEREKGILDVSQIPSGILAHAPGYIDKDREIIVGLGSASSSCPVSPTGTTTSKRSPISSPG